MTDDTTKDRILQAALAAFTERGYEAATIADIRCRSGISTGSIYHHYGSKEAVAAALYAHGIRRYQSGFSQALLGARNAESGIRQAIRFHLDWVGEHPDWARFILGQGRSEWLRPQADMIAAQNRRFREAVEGWFAERAAAGEVMPVPIDVMLALLIGAPQFLVRAWADGRMDALPRDAAGKLADAAWRALQPPTDVGQHETVIAKRKAAT